MADLIVNAAVPVPWSRVHMFYFSALQLLLDSVLSLFK